MLSTIVKLPSLSLLLFSFFLSPLANALPFTVVPKSNTSLPTDLISGQTAYAYYTITNNTLSQRLNNFAKYLPPNVSQVTSDSNVPDLCGTTFNLQPNHITGDSCTLELLISGAVNANDQNQNHHLFICFPGGITCAGTPNPLNVAVVAGNSQYVASSIYSDNLDNNFTGVAVSTTTGTTWTQQVFTPPAGYSDGVFLNVSCSGSACVTVGAYRQGGGQYFPAISVSTNKGNTWTQQMLTIPTDYEAGALNAIYCNSQHCIAGGGYNLTSNSYTIPVIDTTDNMGTSWSQQILTLPIGMIEGYIYNLSCVGNICIGVGGYHTVDDKFPSAIFTSTDNGHTWSQQALPILTDSIYSVLQGVSCAGNTCIAVGENVEDTHPVQALIAISTNSGATWSQQILTPLAPFTVSYIHSISCTTSYCIAVGEYSYDVGYSAYAAVAKSTDHGNSWSQQTLPIPPQYDRSAFDSVTCTSSTCIAVGYYHTVTSSTFPFVAISTDSGNTWSQQALTLPSSMVSGSLNGIG